MKYLKRLRDALKLYFRRGYSWSAAWRLSGEWK